MLERNRRSAPTPVSHPDPSCRLLTATSDRPNAPATVPAPWSCRSSATHYDDPVYLTGVPELPPGLKGHHQQPDRPGALYFLSMTCYFWNRKTHRRLCRLSHTKPNKQRQKLNLYGCFIQMAGDLRRQWVCTLKKPSYILFPGQTFFNREQSVVRGFEIQGKLDLKKTAVFLPWAVSCSQRKEVVCLFPEHKGPDASSCPQAVIFSSAPGGGLSLSRARTGLICSFWNKSFNICIIYQAYNCLP